VIVIEIALVIGLMSLVYACFKSISNQQNQKQSIHVKEEVMKCDDCKKEMPVNALKCPHCGTEYEMIGRHINKRINVPGQKEGDQRVVITDIIIPWYRILEYSFIITICVFVCFFVYSFLFAGCLTSLGR